MLDVFVSKMIVQTYARTCGVMESRTSISWPRNRFLECGACSDVKCDGCFGHLHVNVQIVVADQAHLAANNGTYCNTQERLGSNNGSKRGRRSRSRRSRQARRNSINKERKGSASKSRGGSRKRQRSESKSGDGAVDISKAVLAAMEKKDAAERGGSCGTAGELFGFILHERRRDSWRESSV